MAKRKPEKAESGTGGSSAGKRAPAKQTKSTAPAAKPQGTPLIDTSLAAQAAARMLAAGRARRGQSPEEQREGSLIKQLKADLHKAPAAAVSSVLDKSAPPGQKRPDLPFDHKQVGHNQTFGADLTRSGVPRRTSG